MKKWTQHDARTNQIVDADQFNDQQVAFRGEVAGLDRTQYPANCVTDAMLKPNSRHKVWTFVPWESNAESTQDGEQTRYRAAETSTLPSQFQALTFQEYGSGWATAFETTLTPFKGGSLLTEWFGISSLFVFFTYTIHNKGLAAPLGSGRTNDKYVGLRILYNGTVVAERHGPAKPADNFRIVGESQMPSGDVTLTLQFKVTGPGVDDALSDSTTNDHLMQAHIYANRVVCIGRWR